MGVVEGHAEHVMDIVGAAALPSLDELRSALDRRRSERTPMLAMLEKLIGLEAKLRQYEDGKRFCDAVAGAVGAAGLHRVFDGPEQLPTVAELQDPDAWMRRTGLRLPDRVAAGARWKGGGGRSGPAGDSRLDPLYPPQRPRLGEELVFVLQRSAAGGTNTRSRYYTSRTQA